MKSVTRDMLTPSSTRNDGSGKFAEASLACEEPAVSKKAGKGESVIYWAYERALDLIGVFRRIAPSLIVVAWSFLR